MSENPAAADGSVIEDLQRLPDTLRELGRSALGLTHRSGKSQGFIAGSRESGAGLYPLVALCLLVIVDGFMSVGYFLVSPSLAVSLGIGVGSGPTAFSFLSEVVFAAMIVGAVAMVVLSDRAVGAIRGRAAVIVGVLWSVFLSVGGLLIAARWELLIGLALCGFMAGAAQTLQRPLLMESYPPQFRVRVFSIYAGVLAASAAAAALLVALFTVSFGWTWRLPVIVLGLIGLVAALGAWRLRDPGVGTWDTSQIVDAVREREGGVGESGVEQLPDIEVSAGLLERFRRVLWVPSVRPSLSLFGLFGLFSISMQRSLLYAFEERWGVKPGTRDIFLAVLLLCAVPALIWFGHRGDRIFSGDPARLLRIASTAAAVGMACVFGAIISPVFGVMVALAVVAYAGLYLVLPAASVVLLTVVHPSRRGQASALAGVALALGALVGNSLISTFDTRFGLHVSAFFAALFGVGLAVSSARRAGRAFRGDVDTLVQEIVEDQTLRSMVAGGRHLPLLGCRHIDFSYGQVQVLFGVDLTLDDGEIVALLGTNGAGKSTLLRVIFGLGIPSSGTVHYRGADITYLSRSRRVQLGITQVAGGKAVFGPMSVVDNMRVFGFTMGQDRRGIDKRITESFDTFPQLAMRRNQLASTLSGGEQQMLALSKAFIVQPRLLLVDELSLGLAPKIVGQLLEIVRRINAAGTSVVLVEQSVNIALSLVDHAYYMEKGEMRFDGAATELFDRPDLLRAVFLEGARRGFTGPPAHNNGRNAAGEGEYRS